MQTNCLIKPILNGLESVDYYINCWHFTMTNDIWEGDKLSAILFQFCNSKNDIVWCTLEHLTKGRNNCDYLHFEYLLTCGFLARGHHAHRGTAYLWGQRVASNRRRPYTRRKPSRNIWFYLENLQNLLFLIIRLFAYIFMRIIHDCTVYTCEWNGSNYIPIRFN